MVKGGDRTFYYVPLGWNNLTMKPGEGYKIQVNANCVLNYPVKDPDPAPPRPKPGDDQPSSVEHCAFTRTHDFLPVLINEVRLADRQADAGEEIAVYAGDICVGAASWEAERFGLTAWIDDPTTEAVDGFTNPRGLTFRFWDASENEELIRGVEPGID